MTYYRLAGLLAEADLRLRRGVSVSFVEGKYTLSARGQKLGGQPLPEDLTEWGAEIVAELASREARNGENWVLPPNEGNNEGLMKGQPVQEASE